MSWGFVKVASSVCVSGCRGKEAKDKGLSGWEITSGFVVGNRCARTDGACEYSRGEVSGCDQGTDSAVTC